MTCVVCATRGKKSTVRELGRSKTLLAWTPFHDEGGARHAHDPNLVATSYECGNGHCFIVRSRPRCPQDGCAWNADGAGGAAA